jgi:hypothetical protein
VRRAWKRTYHVQTVAPRRGRDTELALLLARGGAQDTRAAAEGPGSEFGGHCGCVCEGDAVVKGRWWYGSSNATSRSLAWIYDGQLNSHADWLA